MTERSVIVVGGGLAGMVIARELRLRAWRVVLLEKSKRLGGKAGADFQKQTPAEY
jgi:monoamine oxidase